MAKHFSRKGSWTDEDRITVLCLQYVGERWPSVPLSEDTLTNSEYQRIRAQKDVGHYGANDDEDDDEDDRNFFLT